MATAKQKRYSTYLKSGFYNASGVEELQQQAAQYVTDPEALRQQAVTQYTPTFNSTKLAEQQALESSVTGYNNQLSGLDLTYDQRQRSLNAQYDQSQNTMNASALKRGLARSTIPIISGTAIENSRGVALNDVLSKKTDAYGDIYAQLANVQSQSAAKIAQLEADYEAQVEARINELRDTNLTGQSNLAVQIAQMRADGYKAYLASLKKGSGSSSSKSSSTASSAKTTTTAAAPTGDNAASAKPTGQSVDWRLLK